MLVYPSLARVHKGCRRFPRNPPHPSTGRWAKKRAGERREAKRGAEKHREAKRDEERRREAKRGEEREERRERGSVWAKKV
jgi:hypothetical protein